MLLQSSTSVMNTGHYSVFKKSQTPNTEGITGGFKGSTLQWFLTGTDISLRSGPAANPRYNMHEMTL